MDRLTEVQLSAANRGAVLPALSSWQLARHLLMCALASLIAPVPVLAQGQHMVFNVSSYHDVWASADFSTVYGSSSFIDNSSGYGHSGYNTSAFIVTPDGRRFFGGGYLSGYPSGLTNGVVGTYSEVGTIQFQCSCVGTVGSGGSDQACLAHLDRQHSGPRAEQPLASLKRPEGADAHVSSSKPAESMREGSPAKIMEISSVVTVSLPATRRGQP